MSLASSQFLYIIILAPGSDFTDVRDMAYLVPRHPTTITNTILEHDHRYRYVTCTEHNPTQYKNDNITQISQITTITFLMHAYPDWELDGTLLPH